MAQHQRPTSFMEIDPGDTDLTNGSRDHDDSGVRSADESGQTTSRFRLTVNVPSKVEQQLPEYQEKRELSTSKLAVTAKWLVSGATLLMFLACLVFSKLSVIYMTGISVNVSRHQDEGPSAADGGAYSVFLMLLLTIMIPHVMTLIRCLFCGGFRSD
ncbi:hypothetical protein LSH36_145g07034, partial [Paralvinella palmiformis]